MPCNVYAVYNDLKHGLSEYGQLAEQLAIDLFFWFKAHPIPRKHYFKMKTGLDLDKNSLLAAYG